MYRLRPKACRLTVCLFLLVVPLQAWSGRDQDTSTAGGLSVAVDLRHRVVIPQILYFRVGSATPGTVSSVDFTVAPGGATAGNNQTYTGSSAVPIGDGTPITSPNGTLPVEIMGNVGTLTLSYDLSNPLGLTDGVGNFIPFDEFTVTSADATGIPAPTLSNTGGGGAVSVTINGNLHGGRVVQRSTTWTYTYNNTSLPTAGTYTGRVSYTLAAP